MKVEIRLAPETIIIISATLQSVYNSKAHTRKHKSTLSIAIEVAAKLESKVSDLKQKMTLFDAKKKIKVSFKFYEADMLELLLIDQMEHIEEPYIRQQIQTTIDLLNQKLA
jgi:uncharacterized protein YfcZ (UPF0381/DUF406 family)